MPEHSSGKKNRKYNRSRVKCSKYASEHRRTKNNPLRKRRDPERTPHGPHRVDVGPLPTRPNSHVTLPPFVPPWPPLPRPRADAVI